MMQVGLVLPTRFQPTAITHEQLLQLAELVDLNAAESAGGWSHLWVPDSLLALPFLDSGVLLAALAARTRRVRLGVACLASLGLRHPVTVARQWADLDALSQGRMQLVACPGNASGAAVERELDVYGLTYPEKLARFEEGLHFLRAAGSRTPVSFHGQRLHIDDLELVPGFVQRPFPVWIAGNPSAAAGPVTVDRVLGRVARLGDGWMTFNVTPDLLAARVRRLRELRVQEHGAQAGDADFPVCVWVNANVGTDPDAAGRDAVARWAQTSTRNITVEDLSRISAIGSVDQAVDFIGRLRDAGATHLALDPISLNPERQSAVLTELLLPALAGLDEPASAPS